MSEHAEAMAQRLEQTLDRLSIKAAFGEPLREGETTLIPVAEATLGFGFGYGTGPAQKPEGAGKQVPPAESGAEAPPAGPAQLELDKEIGGGGAGGGGRTRPLGYIRIDAEGVRFESIEDETRIAMAGIAMVAWCVFWITMAIRGRRKK